MSATVNRVGLPRDAYKGAATTLCAGCGHNSITNHMIKALYELGVEPHLLAKMSGIGCSSKTPAYFVETAHGFNGVHGRMPALTTGAHLANRQLIMLGVSGDGDTASIGLGDRRPRLGAEEGRRQHLPAHRPLRRRAGARLLVRRPLLQWRRQAGRAT